MKFYETKKVLYIVMELVQGGTLKDYIEKREKNNESLKEEEIALIMKGIFSAVQYMHDMHVLHRDIKPENILFSNENDLSSVKLSDFGLSI